MASRRDGDMLTYVVPESILTESAGLLRSLGEGVRESALLWTGTEQSGNATVERIIVPLQVASPKHFEVSFEERLRIAQELAESEQRLLAQLHTHPGRAFHSLTDDRLALPRHTGAISLVIPNFACEWQGSLFDVSVNIHLGAGVWNELSAQTVATVFEVI